MSGGSMNYLYSKVADAEFKPDTTLRRAFKEHLKLVSVALRAIEWNDSGDGDSSEDEAIEACLPKGARLNQAFAEAKAAVDQVSKAWADMKADMEKQRSGKTRTVEGPGS